MFFSEDLGEIGWGRLMEGMGVIDPLAGRWDCLVAGTAGPVVGRWAFSSRKGACLEGSCRRVLFGILEDLGRVERTFVVVLGFGRMDCRVSRSRDGVEGSEVRCHGALADSFQWAGVAFPCLGSFGVDFR